MTNWVTTTLFWLDYDGEEEINGEKVNIRKQHMERLAEWLDEQLEEYMVCQTEDEIVLHFAWEAMDLREDVPELLKSAPFEIRQVVQQIEYIAVHYGNNTGKPGEVYLYKNLGSIVLEELEEYKYGKEKNYKEFKDVSEEITEKHGLKLYNRVGAEDFPAKEHIITDLSQRGEEIA